MQPVGTVFIARKLLELAPSTGEQPAEGSTDPCHESSLSSGLVAAYIIVSLVLVVLAGLCAGLTLGLLSIDK
jgi:hypothetical protein